MIDINGIQIFYRDIGYGQTVILLHGYGQSSDLFRKVESHLAQDYRVILIDSRGHGRSGHDREPISISLMARDVLAVMDTLDIEKASIIGFSDGGNVALQIAVDNPERLRKIVAISANARPEGLDGILLAGARLWKRVLDLFHIDSDTVNLFLKHPQITDAQLAGITTPTLLLYGNYDIITSAHMRLLNRLIPNSRMRIISPARHGTMMKHWRKYNADIEEFLKE